ncbi:MULTISPECIES: hypothetical protein [unclassified Clostridium]|nr:hypothetical protein [Clostridium sp.]MDY4252814.1 hypothetical protein [Clostridium sp.]
MKIILLGIAIILFGIALILCSSGGPKGIGLVIPFIGLIISIIGACIHEK